MYLYIILIENYEREICLSFSTYLSATMQRLGPLIFGSDGDIVQFLIERQMPSFLRSPLSQMFWGNEDRSVHFCFVCLFVFISANVNLEGQILQLGKNLLVKNTPPIPLNIGGRILHNIPTKFVNILTRRIKFRTNRTLNFNDHLKLQTATNSHLSSTGNQPIRVVNKTITLRDYVSMNSG